MTSERAGHDRVGWPDPWTSAVGLSFDVDAESAFVALGCDLGGHPSLRSHQAYGPEVGVPRILRLLTDRRLRATFFVPGMTAVRHPQVVADILEAGQEIGHHGHEHEALPELSEAGEREVLDRGLAALEQAGGVRPDGFRAPWWDLSTRTLALLAEYGFVYDSSQFGADHPYRCGELLEIPVTWTLDDWERYAFWPGVTGSGVIQRPSTVMADWREELRATSAEGGVSVLTLHPFLSGRPARAAALASLLDDLLAAGDVWVAALSDIAAWVKGQENRGRPGGGRRRGTDPR